jgi:hypothetical protein
MNITHIINLFRAYFIENKKLLLICSVITFALVAWEFTSTAIPEISLMVPYLIPLWIAGTCFQSSLKRNNCTHFFNLPVTTCEKFLYATVSILIIGVVFQLLGIAGAYTGRYLIRPLLYSESYLHYRFNIIEYLLGLKEYLYYAAALIGLFFGSIYFKKNAFWKTLAIGVGFLFSIALYSWALISITFWKEINSAHQYRGSINFNLADTPFWQEHHYIIPIVLIVFFLSLTYLRLRETEV